MDGPWNVSLVKIIKLVYSTMYCQDIVHDTFLIQMHARTGLDPEEEI